MEFKELLGKTLTEIVGEVGGNRMTFKTSEGKEYVLYHSQDCCESVEINDINGELSDLLGTPITMAEEATNSNEPKPSEYCDSFTWTFYKLATQKGFVDVRWLGESNGYYSEGVDFCESGKEW